MVKRRLRVEDEELRRGEMVTAGGWGNEEHTSFIFVLVVDKIHRRRTGGNK